MTRVFPDGLSPRLDSFYTSLSAGSFSSQGAHSLCLRRASKIKPSVCARRRAFLWIHHSAARSHKNSLRSALYLIKKYECGARGARRRAAKREEKIKREMKWETDAFKYLARVNICLSAPVEAGNPREAGVEPVACLTQTQALMSPSTSKNNIFTRKFICVDNNILSCSSCVF